MKRHNFFQEKLKYKQAKHAHAQIVKNAAEAYVEENRDQFKKQTIDQGLAPEKADPVIDKAKQQCIEQALEHYYKYVKRKEAKIRENHIKCSKNDSDVDSKGDSENEMPAPTSPSNS